MNKTKVLSLFTFTLILLSSVFAQALSVKSLSLKQILTFSSVVFRGTLTDSTVTHDTEESGYLVKYFTFQVDECLKGDCGSTVTFKQIANGPKGLPEYTGGKSYLLFLPEASERTGLSAPVGIWQGRYELKEEGGRLVVPALEKKGVAVKALGLKAATTAESGAMSYDSFKQEILNNL